MNICVDLGMEWWLNESRNEKIENPANWKNKSKIFEGRRKDCHETRGKKGIQNWNHIAVTHHIVLVWWRFFSHEVKSIDYIHSVRL